MGSEEDKEALAPFNSLADNTVRNNIKLVNEPRSLNGLVEVFKAAPLAVVKSTTENSNVVVLYDCNLYGMCATAPDLRKPSIPREAFEKHILALRKARCSEEELAASTLPVGDVWTLIDGGQNRKAIFHKSIRPSAKAHPANKKKEKPCGRKS